ncbi:hypothetical protein IMZ48_37885 [Candidatus Bathyarchaeota archaeon]|nr:hypothetical protein [Candidatus Bathyarchaeota archaeon]
MVLETLLPHLEDLTGSHKSPTDSPPHVLHSLRYLVSLASDCCSARRRFLGGTDVPPSSGGPRDDVSDRSSLSAPTHLDDSLVIRLLDVFRHLLEPLPEGFVLPTHTILGESLSSEEGPARGAPSLPGHPQLESDIGVIVEYITASNWPCSFEYLRQALYVLRPTASASQTGASQVAPVSDEETSSLVFLRLLAFFGVDGRKLSLIIQEISSNFLHFRKPFQNTICVVTSLVISRWIDRHPDEFVQVHNHRRRLDSSVDTLFDMAQAAIDNGRRKAIMYPLQIALLFLIPDVFEVAGNMLQAKSSSMSKKVAFLDTLRKSVRNRNEHACYCLVSLLRVARHLDAGSEAALMGYAMDVQDEVREAVFRRSPAGPDVTAFEQDMMTAAFVSFAQLNMDSSVDNLVQDCLVPSAPITFKLAVVQGCCYFAKQNNPAKFERVFTASSPFMQEQFRVSHVHQATSHFSVPY